MIRYQIRKGKPFTFYPGRWCLYERLGKEWRFVTFKYEWQEVVDYLCGMDNERKGQW